MEYILLVEHESTSENTCNLMGLPDSLPSKLENYFKAHNTTYINRKNCFEVDTGAIFVINLLSGPGYKVISQSMAIDVTTIGGGSVKVQKTIWTLGKNH